MSVSNCTSNVTSANCDTLLPAHAPRGYYDACIKTTIVVAMGDQDVTMNSMTCMLKVSLVFTQEAFSLWECLLLGQN